MPTELDELTPQDHAARDRRGRRSRRKPTSRAKKRLEELRKELADLHGTADACARSGTPSGTSSKRCRRAQEIEQLRPGAEEASATTTQQGAEIRHGTLPGSNGGSRRRGTARQKFGERRLLRGVTDYEIASIVSRGRGSRQPSPMRARESSCASIRSCTSVSSGQDEACSCLGCDHPRAIGIKIRASIGSFIFLGRRRRKNRARTHARRGVVHSEDNMVRIDMSVPRTAHSEPSGRCSARFTSVTGRRTAHRSGATQAVLSRPVR